MQRPDATLAVEILNTGTQLPDGIDNVVALLDEGGKLGGKVRLLLIRAQIDGAQTFTLDLQPVEIPLHITHLR